jgi:hypothetical protein
MGYPPAYNLLELYFVLYSTCTVLVLGYMRTVLYSITEWCYYLFFTIIILVLF